MAIIKCKIENGTLKTECAGFKGASCDVRVEPLMRLLDAHTVEHNHTAEYHEQDAETFLEAHNENQQ